MQHGISCCPVIHASTRCNNRYVELIRIKLDDRTKLEQERSSLLALLESDLPADDLRRCVLEAVSNSSSETPWRGSALSTPLPVDCPRQKPGTHELSTQLPVQMPAKIAMMKQRFEELQLDTDDELSLRVANNMTSASFDAFGTSDSKMLNLHVDAGPSGPAESSSV